MKRDGQSLIKVGTSETAEQIGGRERERERVHVTQKCLPLSDSVETVVFGSLFLDVSRAVERVGSETKDLPEERDRVTISLHLVNRLPSNTASCTRRKEQKVTESNTGRNEEEGTPGT